MRTGTQEDVKRSIVWVDTGEVEWKRSIRLLLLIAVMAMGLVATSAVAPASALAGTAQIGVGGGSTCTLATDGSVLCTGYNGAGQLGNGTTTISYIPTPVSGGLSFTQITGGNNFECGLVASGAAYCWGLDNNGEVGDGGGSIKTAPTTVSGGHYFTKVDSGAYYSCAVEKVTGNVYCWGFDVLAAGSLGNGSNATSATPVLVSGGLAFKDVSVGYGHACALTTAGLAYCWGAGSSGQLGNGTSNSSTPIPVNGALTFTSITASYDTSCGLLAAGDAYCWGANGNGQIGDNTLTNRSAPVAVQGGIKFNSLVGGGHFTCGLTTSSAAYCWGENTSGQLGNNGTTQTQVPGLVLGNIKWQSLDANVSGTCGVTNGGSTLCWGAGNYGQIGDNTTNTRWYPTTMWTIYGTASAIATATIDPTLTFTVGAHSGTCNGTTQTAGSSASATIVGLGHVGAANGLSAQDLSVATNAGSGYTVYLRASSALQSSTRTFASVSGTNAAPAAFALTGTEAFGYTTNSSTLLTGAANRFTSGGPLWATLTATNAEVAANTAGTASDTTCIAYQAQTSPTTPAGSYIATVVYTAVPIF